MTKTDNLEQGGVAAEEGTPLKPRDKEPQDGEREKQLFVKRRTRDTGSTGRGEREEDTHGRFEKVREYEGGRNRPRTGTDLRYAHTKNRGQR